jgi:hypothetical protein
MSNKGKWNKAYEGLSERSPYGDTTSYHAAERWLSGQSVEDWGCGKGYFQTIHIGDYFGIDGSETPFANHVEDLTTYKSDSESILLRHVLEHDFNWLKIWENALQSARSRIALILFTPLVNGETKQQDFDQSVGVPDLSPDCNQILICALKAGKELLHVEHIKSETRYGKESILIFGEKQPKPANSLIPKIIHQFWDGPLQPPSKLMERIKLEYQLAGWDYKLWSCQEIKKAFPGGGLFNQRQFEEMPEWSGKCDIARYEILFRYGGFFVDADTSFERTIDDGFLGNECFSCYENEILRNGIVACGYLGSKPNNILMEYIINKISLLYGGSLHPDHSKNTTDKTLAWKSVGPMMLSKSIAEIQYREIAIYPSFYFIPRHYLVQHPAANYTGSFKPYFNSLWGSTPGSSFDYQKSTKSLTVASENPSVSICTITHNRAHFLPQLLKCIEAQSYPAQKIEWLLLDDSSTPWPQSTIQSDSKIDIKYQRLGQKLRLGAKRNLSHKLCSGDIIVYMDDDDYYSPERVSHSVKMLSTGRNEIAGCSVLPIYFTHDKELWLSGPFGNNHATAGTFAMTKKFARSHYYDDNATCNEEKSFLQNYTISMTQLDPDKTMVCLSHSANTFDKKKMRAHGATARMKPLPAEQFPKLLSSFDPEVYLKLDLESTTQKQ